MTISAILIIAAFVLFVLATIGVPNDTGRYNLGWAGAACLTLALALGTL